MKIAIIGLGYVGLPLSLQFARSGVTVLGLDIDPAKVEAINAGRSYIKHIDSSAIAELVGGSVQCGVQEQALTRPPASRSSAAVPAAGSGGVSPPAGTPGGRQRAPATRRSPPAAPLLSASTDFSRVREVDAVIICVPTPLNKNREPDISYILETGKAIAPYLAAPSPEVKTQKSASLKKLQPSLPKLVVLESTTYPGTTDEDLRAVLEKGSGLKAGVDFHLAFSPEREDPGNPASKVAEIPKVIGGYTPACLERAKALYRKAIKTIVPVSSCRAAEATKLLENIFRSVNIALVNELKLVYGAMGIDIWEVINAAKTKPFGYMPFYPGPGLGGHCIPIDPFYLTWKAREYGQATRFIELAGEINTAMPEYVIGRVAEALNSQRKAINGSKVLILGLAYKANVDDDRESPSYRLMDLLKARGAVVAYHDPHVPVIRPSREHSHWAGTKSLVWNRKSIGSSDAVVIATAHDAVNYRELADWAPLIIDTRNVMAELKPQPGQVWKA
ncbi:MAG: nucleotide sugar dehydrogenase [Limisphaerales bacterium]